MGTGKHRAAAPRRQKMGSIVVAGAIPLVLALVGTGTANAEPDPSAPAPPADQSEWPGETEQTGESDPTDRSEQWPAAEAPNVRPYQGLHIPEDTLSSLQWARPLPEQKYLAPLEALHLPVAVAPVPPIAPPPHKLRFGDVQVDSPEWLYREQAIQLNDSAAVAEANMATFLDSVGMERTRSDRIAGQTVGAAAIGAAAGAAVASPFALFGAAVGGVIGGAIGLPFAPIGLAAGPMGAAYGAALMAVPLAAIGAGVGAALGAVHAFSAPPQALSTPPESADMPSESAETAPDADSAPEEANG
ncbi:hypothetical protein OHA40_28495 [Nocardia sp. NBC_00508]|uniref:hypothetical protein n=1 Tax=Nocardia sp. NBC_00508 TaxID=2975992 RepID=UPI002E8179CA|nr:hypothetical protein [Nocardia sp. NBC_00508]WUD65522.1 hypothetical protein OHA40_28495 [Nocardia sp. NBC_00508]